MITRTVTAHSETGASASTSGGLWEGEPGWSAWLNAHAPHAEQDTDAVCHTLEMLGVAFAVVVAEDGVLPRGPDLGHSVPDEMRQLIMRRGEDS